MDIYIDYVQRKNGYCYGILGKDGYIQWNGSIFSELYQVKDEAYRLYPDAVILVKD